ncbi:MAG: alpha/beta fold hydrolase [Gracilimonas sp.]|uniref:alpha/beta fold hydrolase n=1 Tax=Gracilimonas TaxID=649462 RepID=UPI001B106E97|nr:alpha/beta fold hydrolase [Gracilimonas sp.]MBO6587269.1 alpha/beta fold hydrolase [Gracilimonas sp.]MBO6614243.1 alpha/beta fold hydrolase [Gracilimonas sp.]
MRYALIVFWFLIVFHSACRAQSQQNYEKLISVNGTELYVKVMGEGEALMVLHGGPGFNHDYFLPYLTPLAKHFRLILFDQRGMGRSSTNLDSTSFSIDYLVDDIEALRTELDLDAIHLLAHSWGGKLAMKYAIRYPASLKSLILSNTVAPSSEFNEATFAAFSKLNERQNLEELNAILDKIRGGNREVGVFEKFTKLNFRPMFYDTSRVHELTLNFSQTYFETQSLLSLLPPPNQRENLFPDLASVDVPVLIIRGELEPTPIQSDQKLVDTFPDARLINFSKAGHFPFIERPQAFKDSLTEFINKVEAGR